MPAAEDQLAFMDVADAGHHSRGGKIIPFSLHNVDEVLGDLDLNIGRATRATHWLNPVDPAAYRKVTPALLERLASSEPAAEPAGVVPMPAAVADDQPVEAAG